MGPALLPSYAGASVHSAAGGGPQTGDGVVSGSDDDDDEEEEEGAAGKGKAEHGLRPFTRLTKPQIEALR